MKGIFLGVVGLGGIGTVAYVGGGAGPNDYVGIVNKPPEAVYSAFSALGPEGVTSIPTVDGWGARIVQRVIKVPNEQVKLELLIDDEPLITAEVQMAPAENGTRLAAELDFNQAMMTRILEEHGETGLPSFVFQEFMIDQVFARAMGEMVEQIESGQPLASLSATRARWGNGGGGPSSVSGRRVSTTWQQRGAVRPQVDARPTLDPNQAAREHLTPDRPGQNSGW
jgi:hypothetical protein